MFLTFCFLRGRVAANPNPSRQYDQNRNVAEHFASDHVVNRYLYDNLNVLGQNRSARIACLYHHNDYDGDDDRFENSITCRSLFTDKTNHFELKKNHRNNQFLTQYTGYEY